MVQKRDSQTFPPLPDLYLQDDRNQGVKSEGEKEFLWQKVSTPCYSLPAKGG